MPLLKIVKLFLGHLVLRRRVVGLLWLGLERLLPHVLDVWLSALNLDLLRDVQRWVLDVSNDRWLILHFKVDILICVDMVRFHTVVVVTWLLDWSLSHLLQIGHLLNEYLRIVVRCWLIEL